MSNYTPDQIAAFILQHIDNPEVKAILKKHGKNVVPNSLSQLIANFEKVGYKVIKTEEYERLLKREEPSPVVVTPVAPIEVQLFGAKEVEVKVEPEVRTVEETKVVTDEKKLTDPFGEAVLTKESMLGNPSAKVGATMATNSDSTADEKKKEFTHYKELPKPPQDPIENLWYHVLLKAKETSIAFYSKLANAKILGIEGDIVQIGYTSKHTYQMNQLKKGDNLAKLEEIFFSLKHQKVSVSVILMDESSPTKTTTTSQQTDYQLFGARN